LHNEQLIELEISLPFTLQKLGQLKCCSCKVCIGPDVYAAETDTTTIGETTISTKKSTPTSTEITTTHEGTTTITTESTVQTTTG
jgi:hypothetical protein